MAIEDEINPYEGTSLERNSLVGGENEKSGLVNSLIGFWAVGTMGYLASQQEVRDCVVRYFHEYISRLF